MNLNSFLHAQKNALDAGLTVPCVTDPNPNTWFDGDAETHARAVHLCAQCPIRKACADYARTAREPHGTWGGVWRNDKKPLAWNPRRAPLTQDQRDTATRLLSDGNTYTTVAEHLGCPVHQVQEHARRIGHNSKYGTGLPAETREAAARLRAEGHTHRAVAAALGITIHQAQQLARKKDAA